MNFLDMLRNNPRGWGNGAGPEPEIAYQDDGGNLYGFNNALLQKAPAPQQGFGDQSLTDMLIGIGSAPAKMATGLASGMSPYGSDGFQVPPLAGDAWEAINAPGTILNEGMTPQDRDRTATNAAGFMMGGGLVAPRIKGAASKLPMDEASRLTRAQEMGFDTSTPIYHGSRENPKKFDAFDLSKTGKGTDYGWFGEGVYTTPSEWRGSNYAGETGHVRTMYGRMEKPFDWEAGTPRAADYLRSLGVDLNKIPQAEKGAAITKALRSQGYDGVNVKYPGSGRIDEQVFFDPANLRDVEAAFDPSRDGMNGLLFSNGSKGGAGVGAGVVEGAKPIRAYHGTFGGLDGGKFSRSKSGDNYRNSVSDSGISFTSSPEFASEYADSASYFRQMDTAKPRPFDNSWLSPGHGANVLPVEIRGKGAHINAPEDASASFISKEIERLKGEGYDYASFQSNGRNFGASPDRPSATEYNVWNENTVFSPLTGETLFSNGSKPGAAIGNSLVESQQGKALRGPSVIDGDLATGAQDILSRRYRYDPKAHAEMVAKAELEGKSHDEIANMMQDTVKRQHDGEFAGRINQTPSSSNSLLELLLRYIP